GGGTFLSFPALLLAGVSPVSANATNAVALWPASLSTAWALRHNLRSLHWRNYLRPLLLAAATGGLLGGVLLLLISDDAFYQLIPWLLLLATLLFTASRQIAAGLQRWTQRQPDLQRLSRSGWCGQWLVSVYGGFFGAGMGILMIASLAISGRTRMQEINAIKSLLSSVIYSVAALTFMLAGAVHWLALACMLPGSLIGGYCGGLLSRRLGNQQLRWLVIVIGWLLTLFYFWQVYAD
ncbi:MAG: sulfite exporter TauE/SafE family protein, partial [Pseudomonadaceae bacterium]